MSEIKIDISCPSCGLSVDVVVDENYDSFLLYVCPGCMKNVAFYDNKINIISDKLFEKTVRSGRVKACGDLSFGNKKKSKKAESKKKDFVREDRPLNSDDILNLKIALETSKELSEFFEKTTKN